MLTISRLVDHLLKRIVKISLLVVLNSRNLQTYTILWKTKRLKCYEAIHTGIIVLSQSIVQCKSFVTAIVKEQKHIPIVRKMVVQYLHLGLFTRQILWQF